MPTNLLNSFSFDHMAEFIHFMQMPLGTPRLLIRPEQSEGFFQAPGTTSVEFLRTSVESRSFWPLFRFPKAAYRIFDMSKKGGFRSRAGVSREYRQKGRSC
jgi:hypothetical protein